jgi:hypothetical protein
LIHLNGVFIDRLTISQEWPEGAPLLPETEMRCSYDRDSGVVHWETARGQALEGSYSTHLLVRSDGNTVTVSGNPSKWGRLDNLYGLETLQECIALYNRVLRDVGLPEFELLSIVRVAHASLDESDLQGYRQGPVVTRVDLTRNLMFGRGGESLALDWFLSQRWGRLPYRQKGDQSIVAGSSARAMRRLYGKGEEIAEHGAGWRRKRARELLDVRDEAIPYLERLAEWCKEHGVVRDEVQLGRKRLPEMGLRFPEQWGDETPAKVHAEQTAMKSLEAGALTDYSDGVVETLRAAGFGERVSGQMANAVAAWIGGGEWDSGLSVPTRYRYLKALRDHCGLELRQRCNVRSMAHRIKPRVLEGRTMTSADLPDWYRRAA